MTTENPSSESFSLDLGALQKIVNHFQHLAQQGITPTAIRNALRYIEDEAPEQWQAWALSDQKLTKISEKSLHQRLVNLVLYMKTHEKSEAAEYAIPELQSMIRVLHGE